MIISRKVIILMSVLVFLMITECYTFHRKGERTYHLPVIPKPVSVKLLADSCRVTNPLLIYYSDEELSFSAEYLMDRLAALSHISGQSSLTSMIPPGNSPIILTLDKEVKHEEGYRLVIGENIQLTGRKPQGVFYGIQTLIQLIYNSGDSADAIVLPAMDIEDYPRFSWRGMHLDVSRHFFDKEFIKKYLDILALHKMNTFHWHLTDDQGWRIEIKKYPKLTEIGAWRADRESMPWNSRPPQEPGEKATYGGFYTQQDIREIVDYAARRYITVVPEIEMPAHCSSALAAYPQFSCTGKILTVPTGGIWPVANLFCAGNDSTFIFLQDVLREVMELFPSQYIHIGGDEAEKSDWRNCPKCQQRIKKEKLNNENELQSYFIQRIEKFLNQNNRILIGWDEILEGGLADNAVVMSWRGIQGGMAAAKMKHQVIMTPSSHCYFDYYQSFDREIEPLAIGGYTDLRKVYSYEPIPKELSKKESKFILGAQGNVWTEFILSGPQVEYMALPRMSALSEVVWTSAELRQENSFLFRLSAFLNLLHDLDINYHVPAPAGLRNEMIFIDSLKIELTSLFPFGEIWYTLDGNDPLPGKSSRYTAPFIISQQCEIRTALFLNNGKKSMIKSAKVMKKSPRAAISSGREFETGVRYKYFIGKITSLNDFDHLTLHTSGILNQLRLPAERTDDHFGLVLQGYIKIPETGVYLFTVQSDDGSRLFIDGELVVNNDGLHGIESAEGQIPLEKGYHSIQIWYFEATGAEALEVRIKGPGILEKEIPTEMLYRDKEMN